MPFIGVQPADIVLAGGSIGSNIIDSDHYVAGSIDSAHIGNDQLDSQHYAAGSVDLEHMSSQSVDEDNLHISNAGSNGQFLSKQSGNAGGLTWATPSGGAWQFIVEVAGDGSATSAAITSTHITSTYDTYMIDCINVFNSSANYAGKLHTSTDNGSSYRTANYQQTQWYWNSSAGNGNNASNFNTDGVLFHSDSDNALADSWSGHIYMQNPMNSSVHTTFNAHLTSETAGGLNVIYMIGTCVPPEAVNNIKFGYNSGNITGTFRLYGLSKT